MVTMFWSGMGRGSGVSSRAQASVQSFRSIRQGLPVNARDRTVSPLAAARYAPICAGGHSASWTVSQIEPVHTPALPNAIAAAIWAPLPMRPQHEASDFAGVPSSLGSLSDDEIDPGFLVLHRLMDFSAERGDETTTLVDSLNDFRRRRSQRVRDESNLLVSQGDVQLRRRGSNAHA